MFTGIITAVGTLAAIESLTCRVQCPPGWLAATAIGDSIAVNGICLTVTGRGDDDFSCALSAETRRLTAPLSAGERVNLEQALAVGDKLGGHIVSGHVDGTATVRDRATDAAGGITLQLDAPPPLAPLLAVKGSVALAGVSLTINALDDDVAGTAFSVYALPHTLQQTTLADYAPGSKINLEADIIARHIARLADTRV